MFDTIQILHSYWAYLVLLILVLATFNALVKFFGNKEFYNKDLRISLFTLIVSHIQLILGIVFLLVSPLLTTAKEVGMGEVMKNADLRNNLVEHPITMLLAIILITIGFSSHKKKQTSKAKFKTIAIFYTIALILVLAKIPWNTWL